MLSQKYKATAFWPILLAMVTIGGCTSTTTSKPDTSATSATTSSEKPSASASSDKKEEAIAGDIKMDGSSTVFPISEAVAKNYGTSKGGKTKIGIGKSGTGGGFKKFCRGETDISNASRPILEKEMAVCKEKGIEYIELPIAFDALTVVINPGNTFASSLTMAELKTMWAPEAAGKVKNWKEIRAGFPDVTLRLFGAGASSGTFDYFTEAVNGKAKVGRGDYTATEDDNVTVKGVAGDKGALGYFGYSYYEANKSTLKAVAIDSGKGPVLPSVETVKNGTYTPLARPLFIYINAKSMDKPDVKEFVTYYLANVAKTSATTGYIPLSDAIYTKVAAKATAKKTGTAFGGKEAIGVKVDDIVK
jgi:phosphate transport system substrate-binding protein